MQTKISGASRSPLLAFLLFLIAFGLAVRLNARPPVQDAANPAASQERAKAAPAAADGDYVGSETCITCHQDQDRRFKNTPMGRGMRTWKRGAARTPSRFASERTPRIRLPNKIRRASSATRGARTCSGRVARTNRAAWPAWIAIR